MYFTGVKGNILNPCGGFEAIRVTKVLKEERGLFSPSPITPSLILQAYECTYTTATIVEQVEVAVPTAPPGTANQLQPHGAIYPQISLLADKLLCPPAPKTTHSRNTWDSDSD